MYIYAWLIFYDEILGPQANWYSKNPIRHKSTNRLLSMTNDHKL